MNNFAMVIRKELGKTEYTAEDSKKAIYGFLDTLQRQTDDFVEHARDEMKAAGFQTTPWEATSARLRRFHPRYLGDLSIRRPLKVGFPLHLSPWL